ncbi:septal ring lytic transglycosylase RlpA family protein [Brachybacterium hainanense]|uniref:Probable endolytic peptidoglycan transglycosylase RlpA n=1 Tax=Brachybacterium hainanense TaxID=1541174 RepID=A0ABV6R830_9MICO
MAKKAPWIISAATVCVLAAGGGGTAFAMSNAVAVDVYGTQTNVRTFSPTVAEVLAAQGITVKDTDLVTPSLDTQITDGTEISIEQRRPVTITVDGKATEVLTTGTTVSDALSGLEFTAEGAQITPAPETELADDANEVTVLTRKNVTFVGQYGEVTFGVNSLTVGDAMDEVLTDIEPTDTTDVPRETVLEDGMTVHLQRVREKQRTLTEEIPFEKKTEEDSSLEEGTTKVKTEGKKGTKEKVVKDTVVDGKVTGTETVSEKVTVEPVAEVTVTGTKKVEKKKEEKAEETESPSSTSDSSSSRSSSDDSKKSSERSSSSSSRSSERSSEKEESSGTPSGNVNTCGASHYGDGDGTHGGPTASGETFDRNAMTAAHKTLPLGTKIRVTNPSNGKSVTVRINDRGPYVGGRCLDLSSGAFSQIADLGQGHLTVQWQKVS